MVVLRECLFYKGRVTNINYQLCQFILDDKIKVNAGYIFISTDIVKMPAFNEVVEIHKALQDNSCNIILTPSSQLVCDKYSCSSDNEKAKYFLMKLIKPYSLNGNDIIMISKMCDDFIQSDIFSQDFIDKRTVLSQNTTSTDIILSTIEVLKNNDVLNEYSLKNDSQSFSLRTVSEMKCLDEKAQMITDGPDWCFGVQRNINNFDNLLGYLHISRNFNCITLINAKYYLVCLVGSKNKHSYSKKLIQVLNKMVVIRKYFYITEMYKQADACNLEYLYFNYEDITVLNGLSYKDCVIPKNNENHSKIRCTVLHRSSLGLCLRRRIGEYWIHAEIENEYVTECLFSVSSPLLVQHAVNNIGDSIIINVPHAFMRKIKDSSKSEMNTEIRRIYPDLPIFHLPPGTILELDSFSDLDHLLSVDEVLDFLKSDRIHPVSFEGIVASKFFNTPLPSRTELSADMRKNPMFGTPGTKTHTIWIHSPDNDLKRVKIYLNNWEALMCPLGLVPGMRVAVRYVLPQKKVYFKSCILTCFQPLDYQPKYFFNTCHNVVKSFDWGPVCYFGEGLHIPYGVLCWCPVNLVKIQSLAVNFSCATCLCKCSQQQLECCGGKKFDMSMDLTLIVNDVFGKSSITCQIPEVLRVILGFEESEWNEWMSAMNIMKTFNYSMEDELCFNDELCNKMGDTYLFMHSMHLYMNIFASTLCNLDLKCRKIKNDDAGFPLWCCIEARPSRLL